MCVGEIFRRFSTTEAISSKTSDLKHSRMANTMACQDEVQSRSELSDERVPNEEQGRACKNAPEKGAAAAIKRASSLEFNDPGSSMVSPRICILQRRARGWTTSILYRRKKHAGRATWPKIPHPYLCTWQALQTPIPPLILEAKLGTTHHCMIHL